MRHPIDHDGRQQRALTARVIEDFRAFFLGLKNPILKELGSLFIE